MGSGVTVSMAVLQPDAKTVVLTTSPLVNGGCYVLAVRGVTDSCPSNPVVPGSTTVIRSAIKASGPQNLVVIEAENFDDSNSPQLGLQAPLSFVSWLVDNSLPGFSGTGYVAALPDIGLLAGNGPILTPTLYLDY